jgi:fucose 4-O-acetylase-like acetyltransferase
MVMGDVARMAAATPETRNRVVDFLRAFAICVVVLGHWTAAMIHVRPDGELRVDAILNVASWTHPYTWAIQVMPIFFLVGGYANALSWRSAQGRGSTYAEWLRARLRRLGTPVVPMLLVWLVLCTVAWFAGMAPATLRTASQVALVPTWFLAAYVLVVAVTPWTLALWERWRWWSVVAGLAVGGLVDWVSIGLGNELFGFLNYLVVWASVHQLGYAWRDGSLAGTGRRLLLALVGAVGVVLLVWLGPYPVSMVGVDNATLNNSYPTRVTLGFLGMLQGGLLLALEPVLARWLLRATPWRATILVNSRIMTLYLWHLTAMVVTIGSLDALGGFGLHVEPLTAAWWWTRPLWWLGLGAVVAAFIAVFGRFEDPVRDPRPAPPSWRPVLATVAMCGGLGVMAKFGIVSRESLNWWWPLVPVLGLVLTGTVPRRGGRRASSSPPPAARVR